MEKPMIYNIGLRRRDITDSAREGITGEFKNIAIQRMKVIHETLVDKGFKVKWSNLSKTFIDVWNLDSYTLDVLKDLGHTIQKK